MIEVQNLVLLFCIPGVWDLKIIYDFKYISKILIFAYQYYHTLIFQYLHESPLQIFSSSHHQQVPAFTVCKIVLESFDFCTLQLGPTFGDSTLLKRE